MPEGGSPQFKGQGTTARIVDLLDLSAADCVRLGAKAANLSAMALAGLPVPEGFCFRPAAGTLDAQAKDLLVAAWRRSGLRSAAVRSSAGDEDLPGGSLAGVYDSVLGVADEAGLIAAVEACLASAQGPVARAMGVGAKGMAIIVQDLVAADASGVLFTHDPTGDEDCFVINAVRGLGAPLVDGRLDGDLYRLDRAGLEVQFRPGRQDFRLTPDGEVADNGRGRVLSDGVLARLVDLGHRVEGLFGPGQDIEFAVRGDQVFLVQARPIVRRDQRSQSLDARDENRFLAVERRRLRRAVAALRRKGQVEGSDVVFSSGNIGELLPNPKPISMDLFCRVFAGVGGAIPSGRRELGYEVEPQDGDGLFETICGQPYFNLERDAATFRTHPEPDAQSLLSQVRADPNLANYPEFGLYTQFDPEAPNSVAFRNQMLARAERWSGRFPDLRRDLERRLNTNAALPIDGLGADALIGVIDEAVEHLRQVSCRHFVVAARLGFYFAEVVRVRLRRRFGSKADEIWRDLLQGLPGSRITEQSLVLEQVAGGLVDRGAYLRDFGHLAANELELSGPRLNEAPTVLDTMLADLAVSDRRPGDEFNAAQGRRRDREAWLGRQMDDGAWRELSRDLAAAQRFLPLRETVKYFYTADYALIRRALLLLAGQVGLPGDDIFWLRLGELRGLARRGPGAMAPIIARRQKRWAAGRRLSAAGRLAPVIFASQLDGLGDARPVPGGEALQGTGVSAGRAVGRVRILGDGTGGTYRSIRPGDVLVTRSANLGLAPLMRMAAAVVVEVGGVLAHSACQAREAGIPAVVAAGALSMLQDGAQVLVDGDSGLIEVLG